MKKPNITEGEWGVYINTAGAKQIGTGGLGCHGAYPEIAEINHCYFDDETRTANAQAISAVPKLLREAYLTYLMLLAHPEYRIEENQEFVDRVNGLHKALEKAGYEL